MRPDGGQGSSPPRSGFSPAGPPGSGFGSSGLLALAFVLPVVLTGFTLAQVAWNRSTRRGPIVLTEREFHVPPGSGDNSARRGRILWQYRADERDWIRPEALASLGFDLSVDAASPDAPRHYARMLPKRAWIALELGGPAFDALADAARARGSRLVPVDFATDPRTLVVRYPDASRYLITAGVVRMSWRDPPGGTPYVAGGLDSIAPGALHISRDVAPVVAGGRYRVSILYGRRFEPWVVAASR